jgi:hypothetical protein
VVAFDPAANLTLEIALGFAEIGEADRSVIDAVEMRKIVDQCAAESVSRVRGEGKARGRIFAKNDSVDGFHQVKRSAEHGGIVAVKEYLWRGPIGIVKF